jgi:DNA uptake protein ComE-like DNA-binding protein
MITLKSYFDLTKGERNAAFFLLSIILIFSILPFFHQEPQYEKTDFSELLLLAKLDSIEKMQVKNANAGQIVNVKSFPFDPNTATKTTFIELGFSKYIAERIVKFREKGGRFKFKSDLQKIYGIDSLGIRRLWSFIKLPEKGKVIFVKENTVQANFKQRKPPELIELNSTDTTQLISLPMVGSKLANRIINYRNKLGGFYSTLQLMEVYGLKPETFEIIKMRIQVNSDLIAKIDINKCTNEVLNKHPYFGYKISTQLINYRAQHGPYKSLSDLKNVVSISQESIERIKFYIKFL